MDQYVLARFESCLLKCVISGYEDLGNGACGRPLEIRRHGAHGILMRRHKLGMSSAPDYSHDPIASMPALRVRAYLRHFAGKFEPGNVLGSPRRRSVSTLSLQKVRAIESGTPHVNDDFFWSRLRRRNVLNFQNLRTTKTINNNSFHVFFAFKGATVGRPSVAARYTSKCVLRMTGGHGGPPLQLLLSIPKFTNVIDDPVLK